MKSANKRATVYFDSDVHKVLRLKAAQTEKSVSDLVNDAVRSSLSEDAQDIAAFAKRKKEKSISFESALKKLKSSGKI